MKEKANGLRLGVAYYPEHDPEDQWEQDARLMQELGLDCVRIGEFCWSRMQQPDGAFTLDWIARCVELFDRHGLKTILCTPTATPPVWLAERYPDLPCVAPDGRRGLFGGRRHYSVFHEGYLLDCRQIAAALSDRFGRHPAVIGWQLDNEVGSYSHVDCSDPARRAFHRWIERKYGTVEELNRRWGLIFWNQEVQRFDQVPAPTEMMCTRNPSYLLDYNRFCLEGMADFLLLQAREIRARSGQQFVVACATMPVLQTLYRLQRRRGSEDVDAVTVHNYPELAPDPGQTPMFLDMMRGLHSSREYLCLEHQIGSGYTTTGAINPAVRRYWSFETLAHGARAVLWFHWRRFRSGCEWRLTSLLERDRKPRESFRGIGEIVRQMRRIEPHLAGAKVVGDVQLLLSLDNALARDRASEPLFWMEIQLPEACAQRLPMWIKETLRAAYNPLRAFGLTVDFVGEDGDWDVARPVIATDLDICTPELAVKLEGFCRAGGTLVCFPGAGERDENAAHREAPPPGLLAPLFGVELKEYYPLEAGGGSAFDHTAGRATAAAGVDPRRTITRVRVGGADIAFDVRHGEVLDLRGAEAVGSYVEGPYAGSPAVACRKIGKGRAIYLGAVPADAASAEGLYRNILPELTQHRTGCRRVTWQSPRGRVAFLLNDAPTACPLPAPVHDLITDADLRELPPHGVALTVVS